MDFVCYLHEGWKPIIRPASPRRAWMDATPNAFATRCLPLNIANAHGWEICTPAGFSAYWRGGANPDDVIIRPDTDMPVNCAPVALFGQATFTVHIQGIFRTPPGWNLMVMGTPNWAKDGIAALSGIIETDWSPYSFTMNWRFTRRNHWVRWEANEPVCFIMPVQRGALEQFTPRLAPIQDNPDLQRQFAAWSRSRDTFQADVAQNPPQKASGQWQKRYFRGIDMDEKDGAPDHQSKLRLRPFAENPVVARKPAGTEG
ncbi:MAG TPA: DUF6065 family protein [Rhodopila sp.]|nr:DUF6065 family protein [Rhodopila sp.]